MKLIVALILFSWAAWLMPGFAQQPGTPDPNFFQTGRYTINKPGASLQTKFIDFFKVNEGGEIQYKVVTGGIVYENREPVSGFLTEFLKGNGPQGFSADNEFGPVLQGGAYLENGNIAMLRKGTGSETSCHIACNKSPKVPDEEFGNNGIVPLGTENEASYSALGVVKDEEGKNRIVVTGTRKKDHVNYLIHSILFMDQNNNPVFTEVEGISPVIDPLSFPRENTLTTAAKSGNGIMISQYNMLTKVFINKIYPEVSLPGQTYEALGLFVDGEYVYFTGYYYNSETNSKGSVIQALKGSNLENEPALTEKLSGFKPNPASGTEDAYFSHYLRLNLAYQQPGIKSSSLSLYYVSGLMLFTETGKLTTFVACLDENGIRRKDFGVDGYFFVDLDVGNSPGGLVATEDGDLFLAVNALENVFIYKIIGVKPTISTGPIEAESVSVEAFPNPANNQLQVKIETITSGPGTISLRGITGQSLIKKRLALIGGTYNMTTLDLNKLPPGIYFLTLETSGEKINQKIIVQGK